MNLPSSQCYSCDNNNVAPFSCADKYILGAILILSFVVRFYQLETPSMWWDEVLVPMTARYPLEYIFEWARKLEVNTPYYIILIKLNLLLGKSDFCLRLFSAVAGVSAVWAAAHIGRLFFERDAGLVAAALLGSWPLHVLLSRQVRPYALFSFIFLLSIWRLYVLFRDKKGLLRNVFLLWICYTALFMLHYMAIPIVISNGLFVLALVVSQKTPAGKTVIAFGLAVILSFAFVMPFFVGTYMQRSDMLFADASCIDVSIRLLSAMYHIIAPFFVSTSIDYILPSSPYRLLCGGLFLSGVLLCCVLLYRRYKLKVLLLALTIFVPILLFVFMRQHLWRPRHLSFLLPLLCLVIAGIGAGLFSYRLPPPARTAAYAVFLTALFIPGLYLNQGQLYGQESYPDVYKLQARQLNGMISDKMPVMVSALGNFNALAWYLGRFNTNDPLQHQYISPDGDNVRLHLVLPEHFGSSNCYQKDFLDHLGKASGISSISKGQIYDYDWKREARSPLKSGSVSVFSAKAWLFYKNITELSNVTADWENSPSIHPTLNGGPSWFTKLYALETPARDALIEGEIHAFSKGEGNILTGSVSLDGEPPVNVCQVQGKTGAVRSRFKFFKRGPVSTLLFKVDMVCDVLTPSYPGSNLDTVKFNELWLKVTPLTDFRFGSTSLLETFQGLDPEENTPEGRFRWGHGPVTSCSFQVRKAQSVRVAYAFTNVIPGQEVTITHNGDVVGKLKDLLAQKWLTDVVRGELTLEARPGENTVNFQFSKYNGQCNTSTFAPKDTRPMAVAFTKLTIETVEPTQEQGVLRDAIIDNK